jgi:hypothetical protein
MPSPSRTQQLMQTLVDGEFSLIKINTLIIPESTLSAEHFTIFDHAKPLGISPGYNQDGLLVALAIADSEQCIIIETPPSHKKASRPSGQPIDVSPRNSEGLQLLKDKILTRNAGDLFAFDMAPLAMSLYTEFGLKVSNAVDIQSGASASDRWPATAIQTILGSSIPIKEKNIHTVFHDPIYKSNDRNSASALAQRAWISQFLVSYSNGAETFQSISRIDTTLFSPLVCDCLSITKH